MQIDKITHKDDLDWSRLMFYSSDNNGYISVSLSNWWALFKCCPS